MQLRDATVDDTDALAGVFFRAVREGALGPYSDAECTAWAPMRPTAEYWAKRISGLDVVVAERGSTVLGFMSWNTGDGDLDQAFVLPEVRGQGVANAIYAVIENRARSRKVARLHTYASHLAKPFFLRQGWAVLGENQVDLSGVHLTNWRMEKALTQ